MVLNLNDGGINEECGVIAIYGDNGVDPTSAACYGLHALQHRGQTSCGIAVSDDSGMRYRKGNGLVIDYFTPKILEELSGARSAIGHVRQGRKGQESSILAQPIVVNSRIGSLAVSMNGSITNREELMADLKQSGTLFHTNTDAELFINMLSRTCISGNMTGAVISTLAFAKGSYSIVVMTDKEIYALRDSSGNKPLTLGRLNGNWVVASETCALDIIGAEHYRDVLPGEVVRIDDTGLHSELVRGGEQNRCIYEYLYFSRPDSIIDGKSVYESRVEFGRRLAKVLPVKADMVVGVPDSALAAASGYAQASGIPQGDGLYKNRYSGISVSHATHGKPERGVRLKLNAIKDNVAGKKIILVDDSILKGTTSKWIVEMLRAAGAKEVHMRISSPPFKYSCIYGLYSISNSELIGKEHSSDNINAMIGSDTLAFLPLEDMIGAMGEEKDFCSCCFNRE